VSDRQTRLAPSGEPARRPGDPQLARRPVGRWPWAWAGLAAALAGLGVAELLALAGGPSSAPLVAIAQAFIDLTPKWLEQTAIRVFGSHDKQVLLIGAAVVLAAASAGAGLLARRRPRRARGLVLGLGALAALAAVTRPDAGMLSVLPAVTGAVTGAVTLSWLRERGVDAARTTDRGSGPGRRGLLAASGLTASAGALGWLAGFGLGRSARGAEISREETVLPAPVDPAPPLPAAVEVGVPGVTPFRVPNADFYRIDTATVVPRISAADWRLRIHGMVDREVRLDFAGLLAGGLVERDLTLICVSNEVGGPLTGNARWSGLPLGPLLRRAGLHPDADMVLSTSVDGWTCSTPLPVLTDGRDALLAVGMNGVPLPIEHGFPVRMVVPGLYGYVSATKWVTDLEVTRFDRAQAYWTSRGWSARAAVKTSSRIDVPAAGARLRAGRVAVAGVAWAQHRGVRGVEVQVDDGPWQPAELAAEAGVDTWRQWVFRWDATPGPHRLVVRATDGTGQPQTGASAPPAPDGATGWHSVQVDVS
jgi:DMSO/TMAO reductase YedYZ molybdopterin-dependent catalytic subunit